MSFIIRAGSTTFEVSSHTNALQVYNVTVNVIYVKKSISGTGHAEETEETRITNMPCTIQWKSGNEKILFNKETHYLDAVMRCRKTDILVTDRIRYDGKDYDIVDLFDFRNLNKLLVIALRRID